ncbi:hypothetical protein SRRS_47610 [Sporomusa rhizae]
MVIEFNRIKLIGKGLEGMNQHWVRFAVWSLLNPICIIASFAITNYLGMYYTISPNVISFAKEFFPVYVFSGMCALVVQIILACVISRAISPQATIARVLEAFLYAQYPFIVFVFIAPCLFSNIEGNIMGFLYIPIFLVLSAISGVVSLRIYYKKITRLTESEEFHKGGFKGVGYVLLAFLIISLFSIYQFGFNTHLVKYMGWRTDIPQYAVSQAIKAIKERNSEVFAQYVDIDSFLVSTEMADKALVKAEILNAVEQGRLLTGDGERMRIGEWVLAKRNARREVGTFTQIPVVDSFAFSNKGDVTKMTVKFNSDINGDGISVPVVLQKRNGRYIIASGSDFRALLNKINDYHKALEAFPYLANEDIAQSAITVNLQDFSASLPKSGSLVDSYWVENKGEMKSTFEVLPVNITAEVNNTTNIQLNRVNIVAVYRDTRTNQVLAVASGYMYGGKELIQPNEKRNITFVSLVSPVLVDAVASGKAKVAEIYPSKAFSDDGQNLDLLKVQSPKL